MSGRRDVRAFTVGSQLLYNANQKSLGVPVESSGAPIFLGQMHGAELPRSSYVNVSYRFIKKHNAIYRPHPSETDKLSTLTHALWERQGIPIDRSGVPLNELPNPVVSIFSTGVLEAAIRPAGSKNSGTVTAWAAGVKTAPPHHRHLILSQLAASPSSLLNTVWRRNAYSVRYPRARRIQRHTA